MSLSIPFVFAAVTTAFYTPPENIRGTAVRLPDDEANHAARVLRKKPGDEIVVVDGVGGWYQVRLDHVDRRQVTGQVIATQRNVGEPRYRLRVGLAMLKNRNRFETFLEKAAELGVAEVVPLVTARTEKTGFKRERAHNILLAAMKQCGRSRLVRLAEPQDLETTLADTNAGLRLLCHEHAATDQSFTEHLLAHRNATSIDVLIGPEGGFTDDEVADAGAAGWHIASLGTRRLRAETAAITAAAGVALVWG